MSELVSKFNEVNYKDELSRIGLIIMNKLEKYGERRARALFARSGYTEEDIKRLQEKGSC